METLIICDDLGVLITPCTGNFVRPQGNLHFFIVKVPQGKYVKCVDMTDMKNPVVIYEDLPISEQDRLRADIDYLLALQEV